MKFSEEVGNANLESLKRLSNISTLVTCRRH